MRVKALSLITAILFFTGFTFLPAGKINSANKPATSQDVTFVKPGAAVDLTHDYDGKTQKRELETVALTLNHIYEEGYLSVSLLPPPRLQIVSDMNPYKFRLQAGSTFTLPVQFFSAVEGTYSLGLEAVYESLDGHQSRRVLSLPITIGTKTTEKVQSSRLKDVNVTTKGIISLPARETIK